MRLTVCELVSYSVQWIAAAMCMAADDRFLHRDRAGSAAAASILRIHGRYVMVSDERLNYESMTCCKLNTICLEDVFHTYCVQKT